MPYDSHRRQLLQNYFDYKENRVRFNPTSLDAQLLNVIAQSLDDSSIRLSRELSTGNLVTCPTNIDNTGVYYAMPLDNSYILLTNTTSLNTIAGTKNGVVSQLTPYNDLLPTPAGINFDSDRDVTSLSNPILGTIVGTIDDYFETPDIKTLEVQADLPVVNNLSFWYQTDNKVASALDITIFGRKYPQSPWNQNTEFDQENVQILSTGWTPSRLVWQYIDRIIVRDLGEGSTLQINSIDFNIPGRKDPLRPTTLGGFRDQEFDTYWCTSGADLSIKEQYLLDSLTGFVDKTVYYANTSYKDIIVEPNTWGGYLLTDTSLIYFDRRPTLPDFTGTGLQLDPYYGIEVKRNIDYTGAINYIDIIPIAYRLASNVMSYRYVVKNPDGTVVCLMSQGFTPYADNAGWASGKPEKVSIPITQQGTYIITLECMDGASGKRVDVYPYLNHSMDFNTKAVIDITGVVSTPKGIAFDYLNRLWIWDGSFAIPIRPYYNGYVLDINSRTVFLTESWDSVEYS